MTSPSLAELIRAFARIGVTSFGGAAGQIAMMHRLVVDDKKWLDEPRYLHALNYCMLLPGPEAQQLATYIGWLTHGVRGGLIAGGLFVVPGALIMLALSLLYVFGAGVAAIAGVFFGIKAAVLAIVVQALLKIARRGLKTPFLYALAGGALAAILLGDIDFPWIVLGAGGIGAVGARWVPAWLALEEVTADAPLHCVGRASGAFAAAGWSLVAWWAPVGLAALLLGPNHVLVAIGLFFSKLAVVTFGGAYAVLAYLSQAGVEMGWVRAQEMIDGLGLAETTPGPTILVNQFVAFLAGYRGAAPLSPLWGGVLAAGLASWVTFAPSFVWIFAGAPFVETLRRNPRLSGALAGITASVVGVIGYITIWFGLNVLFGQVTEQHVLGLRYFAVTLTSLNPQALGLSALAFILLFAARRGVLTTVGILAALGAGVRLAGH